MLTDSARFKLLGRYKTPKFEYGDVVTDERRGEVKIVGLTDALIPWPVGVPADRSKRQQQVIVLYGGLVDAVRRESAQAVSHWWDVTLAIVSHWRGWLGVSRMTDGSTRLMRDHYDDRADEIITARKSDQTRRRHRAAIRRIMSNPEVRAKIAQSHRGKKRPPHVVKLLKSYSQSRPTIWTAREDKLCRTLPPTTVAKRTGRKLSTIHCRRYVLGVTRKIRRRQK